MPAGDVTRLAGYLIAHPEVSVVEFAGADPLTMNTSALRHFIEPLLAAEHLVSVRLRTAALACWPHRFTADSDADELLRLFDQVSAGGKTLALIADLSHPRELEPDPAREAVRRIRGTGTVIYAEGTLAGTVNDAPGVWAALWRTQVRLGMIPRTMALVPVTGPGTHFRVTLARAQQIFATAYANVSGLARSVQPAGFTTGTVASIALPRGQMAPARSHVSSTAPVIVSPAGPRRPAEVMVSGPSTAPGRIGQPPPSRLLYRLLRSAIAKLLICAGLFLRTWKRQ